MESELIGRLIPIDPNRKFSKLGVFEYFGESDYICFEKVFNHRKEVRTYLIKNQDNEEFVNRKVNHGDIVKLKGYYDEIAGQIIFIAEKGEVLSKCKEGRNSQIFDLSQKVRGITVLRSNLLKSIREYFANNGFIEITTPTLLPFYEGGDANPFVTFNNDKKELFLKETNELILRRLLSCGIGPVYEIGKSFRKINQNKNSLIEFSLVESAVPYASLLDGIDLAEELLKYAFKEISYDKINLEKRWRRLRFEEAYQTFTGQKYVPKMDYYQDRKDLSKVLKNIVGEPTFIVGLPYEISPINSRGELTLNESILVIDGDVYCDICHFETSKQNLEERLSRQNIRTHRNNPQFLKFADYGLVPGAGVAFGLERWMKKISGLDINEIKNLGELYEN